jgi:hypothetical protein
LNQRHGNDHWINPLLKRLDLVAKSEEDPVYNTYWRLIEECELAERIGRLVAEVNRAAGYHVLEMVDFLPPQKNVLRVSFDQDRVKHYLEIAIQESGMVLMFSTMKRASTRWGGYVRIHSIRKNTTLVWEQAIHPVEILEQNIQAWISYLLSGLDKQFRLDQILQASLTPDAGLREGLRKASA